MFSLLHVTLNWNLHGPWQFLGKETLTSKDKNTLKRNVQMRRGWDRQHLKETNIYWIEIMKPFGAVIGPVDANGHSQLSRFGIRSLPLAVSEHIFKKGRKTFDFAHNGGWRMAFVDLSFQVFLLAREFSGIVFGFQAFSFCRKGAHCSQYHFLTF